MAIASTQTVTFLSRMKSIGSRTRRGSETTIASTTAIEPNRPSVSFPSSRSTLR